MNRRPAILPFFLIVATVACLPSANAQQAATRAWSSNVIVPQCYRSSVASASPLRVTKMTANVSILEQVATTTLNVHLKNTGDKRETAEFLLPVPNGAAIRGFTFQGAADEPMAELLTKDKAKSTFDSIVSKLKDPALLEFAGYNLVRTSVFPVEPNGEQQVQLTYEHLLRAHGDRVDYELPRSQSVQYDVPWDVEVNIQSKRTINTVYSPSHQIETIKQGKRQHSVRIAELAKLDPGAFRLSYLLQSGAVTASMFSYPDADQQGGYFLLLGGTATSDASNDESTAKRELTLVIDRSGSMRGEKIEQAKAAALSVLDGLLDGESFNVIIYNDTVESFAPAPIEKNKQTLSAAKQYITTIKAASGTNLHNALLESLRPKPRDGVLPIVLFMTDGLPTVGVKSEHAIRTAAQKANIHSRRVFTFGVGYDVNTPLLDKIALNTRGFATFVKPGEDVEVKVSRVFRGLDGPMLASAKLQAIDAKGNPAVGQIIDVMPGKLPDLYEGDQLVVLGRYTGKPPVGFELGGNQRDEPKKFEFTFKRARGNAKNAFVARLWATRKIAALTDEIRDMGATNLQVAATDPKLKELSDEIIRLSTDFGVLTEYTSFLATEGTDLTDNKEILEQTVANYQTRAIATRSGISAFNQDINIGALRTFACANPRNCYYDAKLNRVAITTVQQATDNAFYHRAGRWVDSRLVDKDAETQDAARVVEFGSPEFSNILWQLVKEGRQSSIALDGDILIDVDGKPTLIKHPPTDTTVKLGDQ